MATPDWLAGMVDDKAERGEVAMTDKSLVPVEQKQVIFYDDELTAVLVEIGEREEIYIPVRPICDYLGLDWSAQFRRINRDPVLSGTIQGVAITTTPSPDGRGGGLQEMVCLPLKFLPGWLFGVSVVRVRPELQDKILRYQRESYDVLWNAFQEGRLTTTDDVTFDELLQRGESEAVEAYKMLQAMVKLARNQILIEARLEYHDSRLTNYETRLEAVETVLGDPGRHITPEQASQLSQAVKAVALKLGQKTGRNEYGGVYGELYRKFGITGYKLLPARRFQEATDWLTNWHQSLVDDVPF
ncbi:MAG: phage antirepressor N-terminal domain-containing protein [Candidatus Promineifilaceae bacterium]